MDIIKEGDQEKVACRTCSKFVTATYKLRDVPFDNGTGTVKNVLVGVCDICDEVCVLPHQSTPAVKKAYAKKYESVDSRIPAHMQDILNLVSEEISGTTDFAPQIIKYYIHGLANNEISSIDLAKYLKSDLATGPSKKRISLKGRTIRSNTNKLKKLASITSNSDVIKSVILKMNDDVLNNKSPKQIKELKRLAAIIS